MNEPPMQPTTTRVGGGISPPGGACDGGGAGIRGMDRRIWSPIAGARAGSCRPVALGITRRARSQSFAQRAADRQAVTGAYTSPHAAPSPSEPIGPSIQLREDAFAVVAIIERRLYMDLLREVEPGHLTGSFRLPFPRTRESMGILELAQLWTRDQGRLNHVSMGSWPLPLDALTPGAEVNRTVLEISVPGRPGARRVPRLVRRGYALVVRAESWIDYGMVFIDVRMGPR